jgi:single-strand DNA-binding protein
VSFEAAFLGTLGRDAESKTSKAGKSYLRLNIRTGDGDAATWINVTSFDPEAIENARRFVRGAGIYIEGRVSLDEWTGADGNKRTGLSCVPWYSRLSQIGRNKPRKSAERPASRSLELTGGTSGGASFDDTIPFAPDWRA